MTVDHARNLITLNELNYLKEFYDFDSKSTSYGITEKGIKRLIVWNKIHGLQDKQKITGTYPVPISESEMNMIYGELLEMKFLTEIWNSDIQDNDISATLSGFEIFESLKFFVDSKLQKRIRQKQKMQNAFDSIIQGIGKTSKTIASMQQPPPSKKRRKRR